jgi:hypothetical protein
MSVGASIRRPFLASAFLVTAALSPAAAQEYCVQCTSPDAIYRCVLDDAKPGIVPSLQMHCISTMAKQGQHGTCSIKRVTVFECNGPVKRIPVVADPGAAAPPAQAAAPVPPPIVKPQPATIDPSAPKTVKELADRTAEKSSAQLKKTGEAIKQTTEKTGEATGSALQKTWACVSSFFTKCN